MSYTHNQYILQACCFSQTSRRLSSDITIFDLPALSLDYFTKLSAFVLQFYLLSSLLHFRFHTQVSCLQQSRISKMIQTQLTTPPIRLLLMMKKIEIKLRSPMWKHFELKTVNGIKNGTNGLHTHHKSCKARFGQKRIDDFQSQLTGKRPKTDASGGSILATHRFSYESSRTDLAMMITKHDYPLSIVEHDGFRHFCNGLQPLFKPICRNTARSDVIKLYTEEKEKIMQFLGSVQGRIAITTDMWTSNNQRKGYMTVTSHFIDDSWKLQCRLLRFIYVPCPHTAEKLSTALLDSLLDWNIERKLSTLTVDNCSTNNCMIDLMIEKLPYDSLILGRSLFHILNLIVRSGLDLFSSGIEKVRESVGFWTATPKRIETFENNAKFLNVSCEKKIALDCKTRWNSTYLMLDTAVKYKKVFYRLKNREPQYKIVPDESEWALAVELCERLKIFYSVTELFSGTKYPTTNMFFPKICEIKLALKKWDKSSFVQISAMAESMIKKFDQYWKDSHGVMAMATILDPRFKLKILEYFFPIIYGVEDAKKEIQKVRLICEDIYKHYESRVESEAHNDDVSSMPTSNQNASGGGDMDSLDAFFSWNSSTSEVSGKNELERYLEESTLPKSREFDVLGWWKLNGSKYPTLCLIARDILAIPISTVASESSFSTSGRIVSPHRSRLLPETIEAIICTQNWLWAGNKGCVIDGVDAQSDGEDEEGNEGSHSNAKK